MVDEASSFKVKRQLTARLLLRKRSAKVSPPLAL